MFGTGKKNDSRKTDPSLLPRLPAVDLLVVASELVIRERAQLTAETLQLPAGQKVEVLSPGDPPPGDVGAPAVYGSWSLGKPGSPTTRPDAPFVSPPASAAGDRSANVEPLPPGVPEGFSLRPSWRPVAIHTAADPAGDSADARL